MRGKKLKIYYAHHVWKYDTEIEKYELELIHNAYPDAIIINPKDAVNQTMTADKIMEECFYLLDDCDAIAFSGINGVVGKGVFDEVNRGVDQFKPIFYICNHRLNQFKFSFDIITNSSTRRLFAIVNWENEVKEVYCIAP